MRISEYHRPSTVDEALALLSRSDAATAAMGGGTSINGLPDVAPDEVVDLQALGLDEISYGEGRLILGATATLTEIMGHKMTPATVIATARRSAPSTIRNAATVGGTIAEADPDDPLLAAFLVYDPRVEMIGSHGVSTLSLAELLADRSALAGSLITALSIEVGGDATWAATARTKADKPIVAVVGRVGSEGETVLAASGVGDTPVLVTGENTFTPKSDFRGSSEYRAHLVEVLSDRVVNRLET